MKVFQNKFVRSFPKTILFLIAAYNFVWIVLENSSRPSIACVICPWYVSNSFPYDQFFLVLAAYFLFIPRLWSYTVAALISGYLTAIWASCIVKWFWTTDYSLGLRLEIILSQYFGNPLQIWETQIVIAGAIFYLAIHSLVKASAGKKKVPLL